MTLRTQAYDAFTRHLLAGRLLPGQFVTQRDLSALVGFPLGAVREMIPRLEAEGLIRTVAQRGLQVMAADPRLIRDAFQLRELIETEAVAHFARSAPIEAIQREQDALDGLARRAASDTVGPGLVADAQAVDWGFHDRIVEHLGNALLTGIHCVNAVRIRVMMYDRVTLTPELLAPALAEHRPIVAALAARDAAAAVTALRAHLASARRRALGLDN